MEMTAFEKMKNTINKGITVVSVKTNTSVEKAKLNTQIDNLEKEIAKLQKEMGNQTYILWKAGKFEISVIEETLYIIDEKRNKMKELQTKIEELLEQGQEVLGEDSKYICICSNCNMEFMEKVNFCIKCGNKIE